MASEIPTAVPDQSTDEHIKEEKSSENIENLEQESTLPSKKTEGRDGEEKVNEEGSLSGEASESELKKNTDCEEIDMPEVLEATKKEEIEKALPSDVALDVGPKEADNSDQTPVSPIPIPQTAVEKESEEPPKASDDLPQTLAEAVVEKPTEVADAASATEFKAVIKPIACSETSVVFGSAQEDEIEPKDQATVAELEEEKEEKPEVSIETELAVAVQEEIETLEADVGAAVGVPKDEKSLIEPDVSVGLEDMKKQEEVTSTSSAITLIKDTETTSVVDVKKEEENVKKDESPLTDATNPLGTGDLNSTAEATKDAGYVGILSEEKEKEIVKGVVPTSVETLRDKEVEGADSGKSVEKTTESELEAKPAKPIRTVIDNSKKAEEETPKSDSLNLIAPTKEGGDQETAGEVSKEEVPAMAARSQSTNIISKVKKTIVKVKKAIIGKSPSSKTLASEGKVEIM